MYSFFQFEFPFSFTRWAKLKDALIDNRSKLGEAQTLQQFSRDADEMENWLQEKLQIALDESYKDPTNIQSKHQKHQAFEAELAANADRLQSLVATGQSKSIWNDLIVSSEQNCIDVLGCILIQTGLFIYKILSLHLEFQC